MNGNITKEGIKLDLEWMHRVGIAGFQNFDAALQTPQVVDKRLAYMTPEWKDAFKYAINLGDQLRNGDGDRRFAGLERNRWAVGASSPGNEEVCLERNGRRGRKAVHGQDRSSARQHRCVSEYGYPRAVWASLNTTPSAVLRGRRGHRLSRSARAQLRKTHAEPKITSSGDGLDPAMLSDGDLEKTTRCPFPRPASESWIQFEYPSPQTIRAPPM